MVRVNIQIQDMHFEINGDDVSVVLQQIETITAWYSKLGQTKQATPITTGVLK